MFTKTFDFTEPKYLTIQYSSFRKKVYVFHRVESFGRSKNNSIIKYLIQIQTQCFHLRICNRSDFSNKSGFGNSSDLKNQYL